MAGAGRAVERRDVPSEPIDQRVPEDRSEGPIESNSSDLQVFMEGLRQHARRRYRLFAAGQASAAEAPPLISQRGFLGLYAPHRGEISRLSRHAVGFRNYFFGF